MQQSRGGEGAKVIYLSPQDASLIKRASANCNESKLILVCGRYEGIDERVIQTEIDEECQSAITFSVVVSYQQ